MRYESFTTRAAALSRLAEHRANGRRGYVLTMRADWFEVRSWF